MTIDEEYGPMGDDADRDSTECPPLKHKYWLTGIVAGPDGIEAVYECTVCGKQIGEAEYFEIDDVPF